MKMDSITPAYPGSNASALEMLALAAQYRAAAETLHANVLPGRAVHWAPFRLCAVHAIELALSAALRHAGTEPARVRGMLHRLGDRASRFDPDQVRLSPKMHKRLRLLEERREYLVVRYGARNLGQTLHPQALLECVRAVETAARAAIEANPAA